MTRGKLCLFSAAAPRLVLATMAALAFSLCAFSQAYAGEKIASEPFVQSKKSLDPVVAVSQEHAHPAAQSLSQPVKTFAFLHYSLGKLQVVNKVYDASDTLEIPVGETRAYGPLQIEMHDCVSTKPSYVPQTASYVVVHEDEDPKRIATYFKAQASLRGESKSNVSAKIGPQAHTAISFHGFLFLERPAVNALESAYYDVRLVSCGGQVISYGDEEEASKEDSVDEVQAPRTFASPSTLTQKKQAQTKREPKKT